ncbi:insulinase family protein [Sphingobium phenoxybenzoativorans]|uniref:Insulinase family protein n=1 Tax=Sphingobium phenoxybenzoativorans TaxID=1592790 RepID=A0A975KBS5_9SPHN|nr:pitrilysin family protein [Sphingobium phenoxybenzoativorans]QUT07072.1 insulinase family protein [Sphingobium phenoxybenzoativorans]
MLRSIAIGLMASSLALSSSLAHAQTAAPVAAAAPAPAAPVEALVAAVDIPYKQFTLKNGLRVIVHTDRKAPVVAVSVWYNVGSKNEPKGKTGFAHLFEHLMFNGSENAPGDFFEPLQQIGATDLNGSTWFDRTNYYETVPTSALEVALFLESDRMGHLLGGIDQAKLDNQRGVVQNEKRQGDNQPYGLVEYAQLAGLLPDGHPYQHSTIGSMADLDSASLADVKDWFIGHYGPNNAVLVLAGDIDVKTAKTLVTKYFGDIPAGAKVAPVNVPVPTLPARKDMVMKDHVATTRLYRWWTVPGLNDPDSVPLGIGASVLGGLASSRLDNILVRDEQLAVSVTADVQDFAQLAFFEVTANVKPGIDPAVVGKRLDEILTDYFAKGPTADEVKRVATTDLSGRIGGLEQVGGDGGKAVTLAEGELYSNDPGFYKKELKEMAAATPAQVTAAMQKWLTRPVFALTVEPGERDAYEEAGGKVSKRTGIVAAPAHYVAEDSEAAPGASAKGPLAAVDRSKLPDVGPIPNIDFPAVETTTLSNGVKVYFARRDTVPTVRMSVVFNAGNAADPKDALGTQALMLTMLKEGTRTLNSVQIAEAQERLGAAIATSASMDSTSVSMYALTPNLAPSLDLLADVIKNPAFDAKELERIRATRLAQIAQELTEPRAIASRTLPPLLYGKDHPYGRPTSGTGDPAVVAKLTRNDLASFHNKWIRGDNAAIFVVGDTTLDVLKPMLEERFGTWRMTRDLPGTKDFNVPVPAAKPQIVLVDRPQSPQSMIYAGQLLDAKGTDDLVDFLQANDIVGGNFLSRINMDLRETKGWSYGVRSTINRFEGQIPFVVLAPVQADKTGASIAVLKQQIGDFLTTKGITQAELERTINGSIRELPGSYETSADVLGEMQRDVMYKRPFDFVETLAERYRKLTAPELDAVARKMIDPAKLTWVVVGDKAQVLPQLKELGMPITVVDSKAAPAK